MTRDGFLAYIEACNNDKACLGFPFTRRPFVGRVAAALAAPPLRDALRLFPRLA